MEKGLIDFRKFALSETKVSPSAFDDIIKTGERMTYPSIVEERTSAIRAVEMNVFSRLIQDRIVYFSGNVDRDQCDVIIAQLLYLSSVEDWDINMYINSPGGEIGYGLGLIDTMNYIKPDIKTTALGLAASMGALILSNGAKGKRSVLKHTRVMIHSAAGGFYGHTADVEIEMEQLKRYQEDCYNILAENCGKSLNKIKKLCDRDKWYIGEEAVTKLNIADKILEKAN